MVMARDSDKSEIDLILLSTDNAALETLDSAAPIVLLTSRRESAEVQTRDGKRVHRLLKPIRRARLLEFMADVLSPLDKSRAASSPVQLQTPLEPKRGRVLLVEDNLINQRVAQVMLERLGYAVQLASNGLEAIEAVRQDRYDIILMDCQMPEMDGFAATQEIRRVQHGDHTPVIALTANAFQEERDRCLAAGMMIICQNRCAATPCLKNCRSGSPLENSRKTLQIQHYSSVAKKHWYGSEQVQLADEGSHSLRRIGHSHARGNRIPAQTIGGCGRPSRPVAYHENLCAPRFPRLYFVPGLPRRHDQRLFPEL
jgi:CheY-like chemotaxis protein